jgi:hypothetical protein
MKYAILKDNKVVNIAIANKPFNKDWIDATGAKIGDTWDGEKFVSPPPSHIELAEAKKARAKADLILAKEEAEGKALNMVYLDKRLTAIETIILGIEKA